LPFRHLPYKEEKQQKDYGTTNKKILLKELDSIDRPLGEDVLNAYGQQKDKAAKDEQPRTM